MNPQTKSEAMNIARVTAATAGKNSKNVIIIPPAVFLYAVKRIHSLVGVQDISEHKNGAHTGQISARMAKDMGARYAIVGHAERRREQYETDAQIAQKILRAHEEKIIPIICIGEIKKQSEKRTWGEIKKRLDAIMPSLRITKKYVIAYEPVWAIGKGKIAENKFISEMIFRIKLYVRAKTKQVPLVLYGGSIDGKSIESLLNYQNVIDGFLVGSASVQKKEIVTIIKKTYGII